MKKLFPQITTGMIVSQIITGLIAYYLLLTANCLHCSISEIIAFAHQQVLHKHLILLGLLPVYIAFVIFGCAMLGAVIGRWMKELTLRSARERKSKIANVQQEPLF